MNFKPTLLAFAAATAAGTTFAQVPPATMGAQVLVGNNGANTTPTGIYVVAPGATTTSNGTAFPVGVSNSGTVLTGLAAGTLSATSLESVNGSQAFAILNAANAAQATADQANNNAGTALNTANQAIINAGNAQNTANAAQQAAANAVQYDNTTTKTDVTFGGAGHAPVKVHNMAAGIAGTDGVNVNQLNDGLANTLNQANAYTDSKVVGAVTTANNYTDQKTKYFQANSAGAASVVTGTDSIAIGPGTVVAGNSAIAGGLNATASANDTVVFGANSTASGVGAVALGSAAAGTAGGAVAIGQGSGASATNSVAVGQTSVATASNAVALGQGAQATKANSVALGSGSITDSVVATTGAVINGKSYAFAGAAPTSTVSVGSAGNERTLTNVAAGVLSATSTAAVNGSQLFATNQAVTELGANVTALGDSVAGNLGGGATYNSTTGAVTAPSYTINGVAYHNVGSALNAVSGAVGSAIATNNSYNLPAPTATGEDSVAVGQGSVADRANTVSFGKPGAERQLTNVAPGTQSTDAVNVGQLQALRRDTNAYADQKFSELDAKMQKQLSGVGAMAMAVSALQPNARAEGNWSVSAAAGTYGGAGAVAAGVNYYASNQVVVNARIGLASSGPAKVGAAVGVTWGF